MARQQLTGQRPDFGMAGVTESTGGGWWRSGLKVSLGLRKNTLNLIINTVTLLVTLAMVATGLLLKVVLPPGSRGGQGLQLWGLGRHSWGDMHFALAVALGALLILHVGLHWPWVCSVVSGWLRHRTAQLDQGPKQRRWVYGVSFLSALCVLVAGFLLVAKMNVRRMGPGAGGDGCTCGGGGNAAALHGANIKHSGGDGTNHRRGMTSNGKPARTGDPNS